MKKTSKPKEYYEALRLLSISDTGGKISVRNKVLQLLKDNPYFKITRGNKHILENIDNIVKVAKLTDPELIEKIWELDVVSFHVIELLARYNKLKKEKYG